jgi:hypothetical protein
MLRAVSMSSAEIALVIGQVGFQQHLQTALQVETEFGRGVQLYQRRTASGVRQFDLVGQVHP